MSEKTREDLSLMFTKILKTYKNDFNSNDPIDVELLGEYVDYINSFGTDLAYSVLYEYRFSRSNSDFFSWYRIKEILKEKLKNTFVDITIARKNLLALILSHGSYNPPESMDELLAMFMNENGGWVAMCQMDRSELLDIFNREYPKIIDKKVNDIMVQEHVR